MRILVTLLVLLGLGVPPAAAQLDPVTDTICIVFDTATQSNCAIASPFTPLTAYVVLLGASEPDLTGWELSLQIQPTPAAPPTYNPPPGIIPIVWGPPDFVCAYGTPQPWAELQVLMTVDVFPIDANPLYFSIGPIASACVDPPAPAYYSGAAYDCIPLVTCTMPGLPVACINCDCEEVIEIVGESWGTIKTMYR
jgi:hypothetical protein